MRWFRRRRTPPSPASVTALVLAGGRSSRFEDPDPKGLAPLQGRPLVRWAAGLAAATSGRTVLVLAPEAEEAEWRKAVGQPTHGTSRRADALTVVRDAAPHEGPVAGVRAGLSMVDTDHVLLLAVDMPLLRPDLVLGLMDRLVGHDAVAYHLDGWWRPFPSLWRRDGLALACERAHAEGVQSLRGMLDLVDARPLGGEFLALFDAPQDALASINSRADLQAAEERLSS